MYLNVMFTSVTLDITWRNFREIGQLYKVVSLVVVVVAVTIAVAVAVVAAAVAAAAAVVVVAVDHKMNKQTIY